MNLGEMQAAISDEINQGSRLDTYIPTYLRMAARMIERNYSFLYMDRFTELQVDVDASNPRFIAWPLEEGQSLLKSIGFLRYAANGKWNFLKPTDANLIKAEESQDSPSYYWLTGSPDGQGYIVLDQPGTTDLTLEFMYKSYTKWPTASTATSWLLNNAEDVLLAQSLILMSGLADEPGWVSKYRPMWEMGIKTIMDADEELKNSGDPQGYRTIMP